MPPVVYSKYQYERALRQKKIAWAKYYDVHNRMLDTVGVLVRQTNLPRVNGELQRPTVLPPHITNELFEMSQQLNKEYTCPICFDLTTKETIYITFCGHIMCKECVEDMKKRYKDNTKCPICRADI